MDSEVVNLEIEQAESFWHEFNAPEARDDMAFYKLCQGVEKLFYVGRNSHAAEVLTYMQTYVKAQSI